MFVFVVFDVLFQPKKRSVFTVFLLKFGLSHFFSMNKGQKDLHLPF